MQMVEVAQVVDVNLAAVGVAAVAKWALGAVWYSPVLFGKQWQGLITASHKLTTKDMKQGAATAFVGSFFSYLVMAYVLAYFMGLLNVTGWVEGVVVGGWVALGFMVTLSLSNALYEGTRKKLWGINISYTVLGMLLMGAILGFWQ
ncbi:DUF1761 domain-containing protein [Candidatus Microgenomates bacterium]|nr:DUF1761 domain-containing protein [Candidatus Microgenomates bacterium]